MVNVLTSGSRHAIRQSSSMMIVVIVEKEMQTELAITGPTQQPNMINCPTGVRVRQVLNSARTTFRWNYYSVKNRGEVACVSADGLRALYHAEVCTDVVGYSTHLEPVRLKIGRHSAIFKANLEETLADGRLMVSAFSDMIDDDDPKL